MSVCAESMERRRWCPLTWMPLQPSTARDVLNGIHILGNRNAPLTTDRWRTSSCKPSDVRRVCAHMRTNLHTPLNHARDSTLEGTARGQRSTYANVLTYTHKQGVPDDIAPHVIHRMCAWCGKSCTVRALRTYAWKQGRKTDPNSYNTSSRTISVDEKQAANRRGVYPTFVCACAVCTFVRGKWEAGSTDDGGTYVRSKRDGYAVMDTLVLYARETRRERKLRSRSERNRITMYVCTR
ncbi:hypothetical protein C8Q70DRAFT_80248 [Cubamyces menziesii]|nr:hypothetical protein C8Q70DRAFT_80248 [Cubamyces menziesii]